MGIYIRKTLLMALLVAVVAIGAIGCAGEEVATPTPTQEPTATPKAAYKVGAIVALTGPASNLGTPEKRTLEMMAEQINEEGGINGHPLEVIIYDTETNVEKCVTMVNRLIEQDNVLTIIGPSTSGESMAILDAVTAAEIPLISLAASINIVTPVEERYWIFKTPQTEVQAIRDIYGYMQGANITKIAIITDTSGYGAAGRDVLIAEAPDYGMTITDDQTFSSGDTDMTAQLTHIRGTNPQAVICWATDKESAVVAQGMKTLQMEAPLFCSHGVANKAFIAAGGESVEGVIIPAGKLLAANEIPASDPQRDVLVSYKADYEAIYGEGTIDTFGGHGYDALSWAVIALEEMPEGLSLDEARASIRDSVETIDNWPGTGGLYNLSPVDHLGMSPGSLLMYEIVEGDWSWLK